MTVKIPLIKKSIACVECRYFAIYKEENRRRLGYCNLKRAPTKDAALECRPKKSWKKK